MEKIIIYSTKDEYLSLKLVDHVISSKILSNYKIDIILSKPDLIRKIKIFIVFLLFGSLKEFFSNLKSRIKVKDILKKNENCKLITDVKDNYKFGLSIYCSSKIKLQKFRIFNFHLGDLINQRGSFIFFYKFVKEWDCVYLTFHEISEKFDVGRVLNEKKILLNNDCKASEIFFLYLKNLDFLIESIKSIDRYEGKIYQNYEKLNLVPSFSSLIYLIFKYFIK